MPGLIDIFAAFRHVTITGKGSAEPQASLAQECYWEQQQTDDVKEAFSLTGTAHLLAISGLHTGIVAGIMLSIGLALFGRRRYFYIWLALGVIWIYAVLTGLEAPVVRSAIMASIFLSAELLGRQRNAITALTFAAAVMTACDPQVIYTASFQMSFMAMCGLVFILPPLQNLENRLIEKLPDRFPVISMLAKFACDSLAVTLAALAGVLPLIAYYFGIISIVSPLATLLVLPVLVGIIILGTLTAVSGLFFIPLSLVFGWLLWLILSYMLFIVEGFAKLSMAYIATGSFNAIYVWLYYIGLAIIIATVNMHKNHVRAQNLDSKRRRQPLLEPQRPMKIDSYLAALSSLPYSCQLRQLILVFCAVNSLRR